MKHFIKKTAINKRRAFSLPAILGISFLLSLGGLASFGSTTALADNCGLNNSNYYDGTNTYSSTPLDGTKGYIDSYNPVVCYDGWSGAWVMVTDGKGGSYPTLAQIGYAKDSSNTGPYEMWYIGNQANGYKGGTCYPGGETCTSAINGNEKYALWYDGSSNTWIFTVNDVGIASVSQSVVNMPMSTLNYSYNSGEIWDRYDQTVGGSNTMVEFSNLADIVQGSGTWNNITSLTPHNSTNYGQLYIPNSSGNYFYIWDSRY